MVTFRERYTSTSLTDLKETTAHDGFQLIKSNDHALFYNLVFDEETKFSKILESITVDSGLYVQLQYNGEFAKLRAFAPYVPCLDFYAP